MSADQKKAMQEGRRESTVVDAYLKALSVPKPRGRPVSVETLERRRREALDEAEQSEGIARLKALQTASDLRDRIEAVRSGRQVDVPALEDAFVEVAQSYSAKHGISYTTWREAGVPAAALRRAGLRQTRRRAKT